MKKFKAKCETCNWVCKGDSMEEVHSKLGAHFDSHPTSDLPVSGYSTKRWSPKEYFAVATLRRRMRNRRKNG